MIAFAGHRGRNGVLRRLCLASVIGCAVAATAWAQAPGNVHDYALPASSLAQSINAIGQSNDVQVIYDAALLKGKTAASISGHFTLGQALDKALAGSGLTYDLVNSGHTVVIRKAPPSPQKNSTTPANEKATETKKSVEPTTLSAVTVTGTRIRGGVTASPTITITAQQIQDEGFSDLGEVIRSVPQNFSGGQNPGVAIGATQGSPSNHNITGGSGMNLRGLGPDATLTLLNGHRMSYGGFAQAVDISAIPVEAVERLEIVPDGASAIYGSDAVGGVANVILKRDFTGVTLDARYGGATEGGLITREYNATAGTTWATGGLITAGEKTSNDPIYSEQRDYTQSMYRPSTLWQGNDLRSGLFSLHQSLGDDVELHLDALGNDRNSHTTLAYPSVYYPYLNVKTNTTLLAPSLEVWLPGDWTLTLSGAVGKVKNSEAEPTVSRASGATTANSIVTYRNKSLTYEIGAEGPLFTLPGGEARLATGVGYRYNDFLELSGNTVRSDGDESSRFAYAELNLPLVGPEQGIGGIERLALTGAIRTEDGDYGRVTTPKLGVIYSPSADVSLKASWGKSFKAPTLEQRYSTQTAIYYPASTFGAGYPTDATALWLSGGNADLHPERARTWSASLVFHPEALSNLDTELTWFDIDYTQRVLQPITTSDVFGNPIYVDFVDYDPTEGAQATALAGTSNFYNYVGAPYDTSKVVAIVDGGYANAAQQRIKGVDLSGSYRFDLGMGRLTIRGSVSWLDSTQALIAGQSHSDLSGTLFHPARINSRVGAVWRQGSFTASLFGNYKGGVTDTADGNKGASFTTFDATLRYDTGARDDAWSNLALELSVQNVLNRAPPLFTPISWTFTPYDSTNYSAVGRYLSLSVSKHF